MRLMRKACFLMHIAILPMLLQALTDAKGLLRLRRGSPPSSTKPEQLIVKHVDILHQTM